MEQSQQLDISTTNGNISATNGLIRGKGILSSTTITDTGNINGATGSFTGTGKPTAPTGVGEYFGADTTVAAV